MTQSQQIEAFVCDISAVVARYNQEFELPLASVIGCLDLVKMNLFLTEREIADEDDGHS